MPVQVALNPAEINDAKGVMVSLPLAVGSSVMDVCRHCAVSMVEESVQTVVLTFC